MPKPEYKGDSSWKQQRGTSFGTDEEGKDWIELTFRGKSDLALSFREQYSKGTDCPEPGFSHCKLLSPPDIEEESIAFSYAILRFEGASPLSGTFEGTDATIEHSTQEADLTFTHFTNGQKLDVVFRYHRVIVTASYIKATRPTSTRYNSELDKHAEGNGVLELIADVKVPDGAHHYKYIKRNKAKYYKVDQWSTVSNWTETAPGIYEVKEEHSKFLTILDDVDVGIKK